VSDGADIAIVGAGAAGLAAAIFAGEALAGAGARIILLEGARKPGAKILVSGGGRCNVTNETVTEEDYWGGPRKLVRNVLRAFGNDRTLEWMRAMGVELKLEDTGKWFPVSNQARTVLDALLRRSASLGVELRAGWRAAEAVREGEGFLVRPADGAGSVRARRLVLAAGGMSLPKSGSDGWGFAQARTLGHRIVATTPALSPLVARNDGSLGGRFSEFAGVTLDARLALTCGGGRLLEERAGSLLFTHFGLSGPAALDLSRHFLRACLEAPASSFSVRFGLAMFRTVQDADEWLQKQARAHARRTVTSVLCGIMPERMARAWAEDAAPADTAMASLTRAARLALAESLARLPIPVTGDRGWSFAETTAGGVALDEVDVRTMESRVVPGLHLCGEMLDVDGRLGGFNFQWAWASGHAAGRGAARGAVG